MFLLAEWGDGSVTEIAETIGSTGSAVHRILTALKRKEVVAQDGDSQRYSLSWSVLSLARSLSARADIRTLAHPKMVRLRDLSEETLTLNMRSGLNRVCIEQVESPHEVQATVFGWNGSAFSLGAAAGPIAGGFVAAALGLSAGFGVAAAGALLLAAVLGLGAREPLITPSGAQAAEPIS